MKREGIKFLYLLSVLLLPFVAPSIQAQSFRESFPSHQRLSRFRWEGTVDGTIVIRLRRRQIDVETLSGLPVQQQRYDFTSPLPSASTDLKLTIIEGRGRVRLIEQPRTSNDYVAVVRIEDEKPGRSYYAFELHWESRTWFDDEDRPRSRPRETEWFEWRGQVDDVSIIRIQGEEVRVEDLSGRGVWDERYRFSSPLPAQPLQVSLVETEGRGEIVLIEQPSRANNYSAAVRITDRQGGASRYSFTLSWVQPRYRERPRERDEGRTPQRGLIWSGRVDGRDLLRIRGREVWIEHQAGVPVVGTDYRFDSALPIEPRAVTVRKLEGRGTVRVIEQPTRANNFTATILLEDKKGGSDQYRIEVYW